MGYLKGKIIGLGLLVLLIWLVGVFRDNQSSTITTPPVAFAPPTRTPIATNLAALAMNQVQCTRWDQISKSQEGSTICVYGNLAYHKQITSTDFSVPYILYRFANDMRSFYITAHYEFADPGDCIQTSSLLQYDGNGVPFMKAERLDKCGARAETVAMVETSVAEDDQANSFDSSVPLCSDLGGKLGERVSCQIPQPTCAWFLNVEGSPTFCDDKPYPGNRFQLVVWGEDWTDLGGHCLIVTGKLETFKGRLQIVAESREQIAYCK